MARIRIPTSALDLLPFCQTAQDRHPEVLFQSYAALITTAAAYGFHSAGRRVPEVTKFLSSPEPIDLGIFRSQDLYPQLLLLSLACADESAGEDPLDEDYLSRLIENLAGAGSKALSTKLAAAGGPSTFVYALGEEQSKACKVTI
jgi:hypothetical protein